MCVCVCSISVTVSLVTIKGTDCKTLELGQVADTTGGQVGGQHGTLHTAVSKDCT